MKKRVIDNERKIATNINTNVKNRSKGSNKRKITTSPQTITKLTNAAIKFINNRGNNEYDPVLAKKQITLALQDINKRADIVDGEVIGAGWWNVVIRVQKRFFRIWYRKIWPDSDKWNAEQCELLNSNGPTTYGLLAPISYHNENNEYQYWEIRYAQECQGYTYEQLQSLFNKVLGLAKYKLVWWDFNPDNIMTYNSEPVFTDFDMQDEESTKHQVLTCCKESNKSDILKRIRGMIERPLKPMEWWRLPLLFCKYHNYVTAEAFMKCYFKFGLYLCKYHLQKQVLTRSLFEHMITS